MQENVQEHHRTDYATALASSAIAGVSVSLLKPEFVRLPKPGTQCPHSGLCRTTLYALCAEGKVKSVVLRKRGATRGVRLISFDSLMAYLHSLSDSN